MSTYRPGQRLFVAYLGLDTFHERIILGHIEGTEYLICTPDFDVYIEGYGASINDFDAIRVQAAPGQVPLGVLG